MHYSIRAVIVAAGLSLVLGVVAADAKGPGHGGAGSRGASAHAFKGGNPPGFSHGRKTGWTNGQPPGWSKGKKTGWNGANKPPGLVDR